MNRYMFLTRISPGQPRGRHGFTLVEILAVVVIIIILMGIGLSVGGHVVQSGMKARASETLKNLELIATEYNALTNQDVNHLLAGDWGEDIADTNTGTAQVSGPFYWNQPKTYNTEVKEGSQATNLGLAGSSLPGAYNNADVPLGHRDNPEGDIPMKSIDRFVWATLSVTALSSMYGGFPEDTLTDRDNAANTVGNFGKAPEGYLEVRDPWGSKYVYVAFVRHKDRETSSANSEGLGAGADNFLPRSDTPYFASPGPDRKWGHVDLDSDHQKVKDTNGGTSAANIERLRLESADNIYSNEVLGAQ